MKFRTDRNYDVEIASETDEDNEIHIQFNGAWETLDTYLSVAEAVRVGTVLLQAAGAYGASDAGVTEDRVRDIVREVLRDTFNN